MDRQHFTQLVNGVREMKCEMKRQLAGKIVCGARTTELPALDVRTIREAAKISQSQYAKLIGVNLRMLQNWEQQRTQPIEPASSLSDLTKKLRTIRQVMRAMNFHTSVCSLFNAAHTGHSGTF